MRQFYVEYHVEKRLQPLVGEISWAKHLIVMAKCKDPLQREFYIRMTRKFGWSKNVLIHQIENQSYEKTLLNQTNFDQTLTPELRNQAKLALKDEYTFNFLELGEEHAERELERALIARIEDFLRAMGGLFAFVGSQFRLEVDDKEFFIDLLLFHRRLKCLVAVELKVGEFAPEFVGKMQFYLAALDDRVREEGENASIGIILCKEKRRTIVEYAPRDARKPIGVATYRIVRRLPKELQSQFPFAKITPCMQNGKHTIAKGLIGGIGFGTTEFHVLRPNENIISELIWFFIRQPSVLIEATEHFTGAVGQQRVPEDYLANLEIPLPPLSEQQQIVGVLMEQMASIEKARAAAKEELNTINALPAALLRRAFAGEL